MAEVPASPELTLVMPCLNEARSLGDCIREAQAAIAQAGLSGEIVIADNGSSDESVTIATRLGARVVSVAEKGYGHALRGGIAAARGRYIVMGDAVYGWKPDSRLKHQPERVMLHAEHLIFQHPVTGKTLDLRAPMPADMEAMLAQLRKLTVASAKARRLKETPVKPRKKPAPPAFHPHESRK